MASARGHSVAAMVAATTSGGLRVSGSVAEQQPWQSVDHGVAESPAGPLIRIVAGDARHLRSDTGPVDLVVTSPPYWRKRDYGVAGQIGQEPTPDEYVAAIRAALSDWRRYLRPTGSVFLNVGDSYWRRSLAGIPGRIEQAAREVGWCVRNRIIWSKDAGMPDPVKDRLAGRHEYVLHLTNRVHGYYYDLLGYSETYGNGANPGDVWNIRPGRRMDGHLAPFPEELVERAITLACPSSVCLSCGEPRRRITRRTTQLDVTRPQARRALEIAQQHGLTPEHLAAVQSTGVCDAGKALLVQNGTGRNSERVKALAREAKQVLGGYFREFTFAKRETTGWTSCACGSEFTRGVVLDPFMGSGTSLRVAARLGRDAIGVDLIPGTSDA